MATEQLVEQAAEGLEEVAERIEDVAEVTRRLTRREVGFFLGGFGVGFALGWVTSAKRLKTKYEREFEEEVAGMRQHYRQKLTALNEKKKVEDLVDELGYKGPTQEDTTRTDYRSTGDDNQQEEVQASSESVQEEAAIENVFNPRTGETIDVWNYDEELRSRTQTKPYVIHADEFRENETNYDQVTYTWWEGNNILTAVNDEIVDEVDRIVGLENLEKFGHGSGQQHVVYVRNDSLSMDIEILRSESDYAEVVHGLNIEHSDESSRRRRRPKFDDD